MAATASRPPNEMDAWAYHLFPELAAARPPVVPVPQLNAGAPISQLLPLGALAPGLLRESIVSFTFPASATADASFTLEPALDSIEAIQLLNIEALPALTAGLPVGTTSLAVHLPGSGSSAHGYGDYFGTLGTTSLAPRNSRLGAHMVATGTTWDNKASLVYSEKFPYARVRHTWQRPHIQVRCQPADTVLVVPSTTSLTVNVKVITRGTSK